MMICVSAGGLPPVTMVLSGDVFRGIKQGKKEKRMKNKKKQTKTVVSAAATAAAMAAVAGAAYAAYNSRPMKIKRMIRRAGNTVDNFGRMLTDMAKM